MNNMTDSLGGIQVGWDDIGRKRRPDRNFNGAIRPTSGLYICASAEPLAGCYDVGSK